MEGRMSTTVAAPSRQARERTAERKAAQPGARAYPKRVPRAAASSEQNESIFAGRIPFVVTIICLMACGLALTLLLTTHSAEVSYQLAKARDVNQQLANERAVLQRQVESADSAPELAAAAARLGMVPARDPARLVVAPDGGVTVVGKPKAAADAPAPLLNPVTPPPPGVGPMPMPAVPGVFPPSGAAGGATAQPQGERLIPVPIGTVGQLTQTAQPGGR
jgi:hypothetical protein